MYMCIFYIVFEKKKKKAYGVFTSFDFFKSFFLLVLCYFPQINPLRTQNHYSDKL